MCRIVEVVVNPKPNVPIDKKQRLPPARSNLTIRAKDIMATNITTVEPETSVRGVAQLLCERHISAVIVADRGSIVGVVSEGDLMNRQELGTEFVRASLSGEFVDSREMRDAEAKSHGMRARDVMTRDVIAVQEDSSWQTWSKLFKFII
jgi:CBS domain-containing protein